MTSVVHRFPPLALAEVRVENGLAGLEPWERLAVLRHAVVREMLGRRDPLAEGGDFIAELQAEIAFVFLPASTESPVQE